MPLTRGGAHARRRQRHDRGVTGGGVVTAQVQTLLQRMSDANRIMVQEEDNDITIFKI